MIVRGSFDVASRARVRANSAYAELALVDGAPGVVVAPEGRLTLVLRFGVAADTIAHIDIEADPNRLRDLEFGRTGLILRSY